MATGFDPYKKLISKCNTALEQLSEDVRDLNPHQLVKLKECENRLSKIKSKVKSMKNQLSYQDDEFQRHIQQQYGSDLIDMAAKMADIATTIATKAWLREMVGNLPMGKKILKLSRSVIKGIIWILELLHISTRLFKFLLRAADQLLLYSGSKKQLTA